MTSLISADSGDMLICPPINQEYNLDSLDMNYHRGMRARSWSDDTGFGSYSIGRRANLVVLFEFLGAHHVAEQLRYNRHERPITSRLSSNRLLLGS